jgi:hypothetical protein
VNNNEIHHIYVGTGHNQNIQKTVEQHRIRGKVVEVGQDHLKHNIFIGKISRQNSH